MEEIMKYLTNPVWWITVVFVSFLLNVLAAYFKNFLDNLISKVSESRKKRIDNDNEKMEKLIDYLLDNHSEVTDLRLDIIIAVLKVILITAISIIVILSIDIILLFFTLPENTYFIYKFLSYLIFSYLIISRIRDYFFLRNVLVQYNKCVHTISSRFKKDEFK